MDEQILELLRQGVPIDMYFHVVENGISSSYFGVVTGYRGGVLIVRDRYGVRRYIEPENFRHILCGFIVEGNIRYSSPGV